VASPWNFDGHPVRIIEVDGEPWFVLADVCKVLEVGNPSDAARRLDEDERHDLDIIDPMGRPQTATGVNESGLYSLILTSRKPDAKRFRKWVTGDVLPSIRKTGAYV
jgi:anti-repressor protein